MRIKAILLIIMILLQPFTTAAAMFAMQGHAGSQLAEPQSVTADADHCADHNSGEHAADDSGAQGGTEPECLDECELCAGTAAPLLSIAVVPARLTPASSFSSLRDVPSARQHIDLLYRPPIIS